MALHWHGSGILIVSLVSLIGSGLWLPIAFGGFNIAIRSSADGVIDADEEEFQIIGRLRIDGGGSKTFGTSGSKVSWLPGTPITFAANSTVRLGVKKASSIDTTAGPPARATIGAAAFDVYDDLVGGTDTITALTWRNDAMSAGTPFTITDGDLLAICFHLDTTSGSPSVKVRGMSATTPTAFVSETLVTSGPTYTVQGNQPNVILTFDDGTLGWLEGTTIYSVADAASGTIGNTNIFGNIFQVPYACAIDALAAILTPSTSAANFSLALYSTPLGTPGLVEAVSVDANVMGNNLQRWTIVPLTTPRTLTINTDYAIGVRQDTATAVTVEQYDVNDASFFKPNGMGAECYAATSTAAATFAAINSGKRRYHVYARICKLDNGASVAGSAGLFIQ